MTFLLPEPELQAAFAAALPDIRKSCLQDALLATVATASIPTLDSELARLVPQATLATLASYGLRGELVFPLPSLLSAKPSLLGYYRLLYGYSKKEFYTKQTGFGALKAMEESERLPKGADLEAACTELCAAGVLLVSAISTPLTALFLDSLTLLTLGPQLRGRANVKRGMAGIATVFNAIQKIVSHAIDIASPTAMQLTNAAGRKVFIEFAADPDITIREQMQSGAPRLQIAIEVKAGKDFSNIHNRLGEAEKSHQKAKKAGYSECWTIVNVDKTDMAKAATASPTTNRFYRISDIVGETGSEYQDFIDRILSLTGIASH